MNRTNWFNSVEDKDYQRDAIWKKVYTYVRSVWFQYANIFIGNSVVENLWRTGMLGSDHRLLVSRPWSSGDQQFFSNQVRKTNTLAFLYSIVSLCLRFDTHGLFLYSIWTTWPNLQYFSSSSRHVIFLPSESVSHPDTRWGHSFFYPSNWCNLTIILWSMKIGWHRQHISFNCTERKFVTVLSKQNPQHKNKYFPI